MCQWYFNKEREGVDVDAGVDAPNLNWSTSSDEVMPLKAAIMMSDIDGDDDDDDDEVAAIGASVTWSEGMV